MKSACLILENTTSTNSSNMVIWYNIEIHSYEPQECPIYSLHAHKKQSRNLTRLNLVLVTDSRQHWALEKMCDKCQWYTNIHHVIVDMIHSLDSSYKIAIAWESS